MFEMRSKGILITAAILIAVGIGVALGVAFAVMVASQSSSSRVGLEQSETINAKLRYDRSKRLVDDAVWLGTREAYLENDGDPDENDIESKIMEYIRGLNSTEMTQSSKNPDYYVDVKVLDLEVGNHPDPEEVDFPVYGVAWGSTTDRGVGWGDCSAMEGNWEEIDQFCSCMGYKGAMPESQNPCYQDEGHSETYLWEVNDNSGSCIEQIDSPTQPEDALTKVRCKNHAYDVSYTVDLSGSMSKPRITLSDKYSSSQVIKPTILDVSSTQGGYVHLEGYPDLDYEGQFVYDKGEEVSLEVNPDEDSYFKGWSGDVKDAQKEKENINITMNEDKRVKAHFEEVPAQLNCNMENKTITDQSGYEGVISPNCSNDEFLLTGDCYEVDDESYGGTLLQAGREGGDNNAWKCRWRDLDNADITAYAVCCGHNEK